MLKKGNKAKYVGNIDELPLIDVSSFIPNGTKQIVFGPDHFWDDYVMRSFALKPGASVPLNQHPWPHWAICLRGEGVFVVDKYEYSISNGSWMHVPNNIPHTFWNISTTESLVVLCIVPPEGDMNPLEFGGIC